MALPETASRTATWQVQVNFGKPRGAAIDDEPLVPVHLFMTIPRRGEQPDSPGESGIPRARRQRGGPGSAARERLESSHMRIRGLVLGVAALVALASGCGGRTEPDQAAPVGGEKAAGSGQDVDLDKVDACALLSDEELRGFFGEAPGEKTPKPAPYLRGCALDDISGTSYVFVSVQVPPIGDKKQFDHDRSQTKKPVVITGVGEEAFGRYNDEEAEVETRYRGAVVILTVLLYSYSGKLDDPAAVLDKLTALTRHALARL
jgi:hypothetical protein